MTSAPTPPLPTPAGVVRPLWITGRRTRADPCARHDVGVGGPPRTYLADPADKRPFSQAVVVGDTLYVAGTLGGRQAGKVPADPKAEIKLALDTMRHTIESAGFKKDGLVSVQVFCTDLAMYDTFHEKLAAAAAPPGAKLEVVSS